MSGKHIVCFGECMIELSRTILGGQSWAVQFAGDSYNVAAYLARLGCTVSYMTALGKDHFSDEMLAEWRSEGVATDLVVTHPDRIPGLYSISVDDVGERSFLYWRDNSAARAFFDCPGADRSMQHAETADVLYLSGITLSLFAEAERERINGLANAVRAKGGEIIFDTNYRAKGWPDAATARQALDQFGRLATIVLPTLEDDQVLYGDLDHDRCADRWLNAGVREVAVKLGAAGVYVASKSARELVAPPSAIAARDTTGAGDSFNAAYLAARLDGHSQVVAAQCGNRLAGAVVRHPGAIIRKLLMPTQVLPAAAGSERL
jgi:2-dehydro-3-deoxygluconokinase